MSDTTGFLNFLNAAPTAYHAVQETRKLLTAAGFVELSEKESWTSAPGARQFVVRAGKTIAAWITGAGPLNMHGLAIVGAHTDSPSLKPRTTALKKSRGVSVLTTGVYGSPILQSWLDRDLGVAGAVFLKGKAEPFVFKSERLRLRTSGLAIHLDKSLRDPGLKPNPQKHMDCLVAADGDGVGGADDLKTLIAAEIGIDEKDISAMDVSLFDAMDATCVGENGGMISGARLDNLFSCYSAIRALCDEAEATEHTRAIVLFDAEEIGSRTSLGAQSTFLSQVITRLCMAVGGEEYQGDDTYRTLACSRLLSLDMAHGLHPLHPEATDDVVVPELNKGCALKYSHRGHYADAPALAGRIKDMAGLLDIPVQSFSYRNDLGGGTSIGPIVAAEMGIATIDAGAPMLAMHSIRELAGCDDLGHTIALLRDVFFRLPH